MRLEQDEHVTFLRGFLQRPQQVGSVIPSSRFLERRLVELAGLDGAATVVELGSGTGGTTRAILRAMRADAVLLSVEINPEFHAFVRRIRDPRLIAHLGSAIELRAIMQRHGLTQADAVISGIPFSTMDRDSATLVPEAISKALAPGGRFVAYQVRRRVESLCRPHLGEAQVALEFLNIPPIWVFRWQKPVLNGQINE
jgi:phosphatidylethanolamine/phosphatidyl-N-methylethanolamine N-methyltransferase